MKIKDIPLQNRPHERLEKYGTKVLNDAELISIIISSGVKGHNVIDLSNNLLKKFNLEKISKASYSELKTVHGMGKIKAMKIIAAIELSKRIKFSRLKYTINNSYNVYHFMKNKISNLEKEHFIVLMLDTKNKIIKEEIVSIGTIDATIIHPREIFKSAIKENSNSIILVHNHPSGNPLPSSEDLDITEKIIKAGETLGIKVLDHIIIGNRKYWSYTEKHKL
jgi:DNA repair protein RadC